MAPQGAVRASGFRCAQTGAPEARKANLIRLAFDWVGRRGLTGL